MNIKLASHCDSYYRLITYFYGNAEIKTDIFIHHHSCSIWQVHYLKIYFICRICCEHYNSAVPVVYLNRWIKIKSLLLFDFVSNVLIRHFFKTCFCAQCGQCSQPITLRKDIFSGWGATAFLGTATTNWTTVPAINYKWVCSTNRMINNGGKTTTRHSTILFTIKFAWANKKKQTNHFLPLGYSAEHRTITHTHTLCTLSAMQNCSTHQSWPSAWQHTSCSHQM